MKLELKHLAPYLAYEIPIEILNYKCDYVGVQYTKANGFYIMAGDFYLTYEGGSTGKSISDFKPLLLPLSKLTNEQWREIFQAGFENNINKGYRSMDDFDKIRHDNAIELVLGKLSISYDFENCQFNTEPRAFNQFYAFEKLFKYHADVFGLIDAGLAIDKTSLKIH